MATFDLSNGAAGHVTTLAQLLKSTDEMRKDGLSETQIQRHYAMDLAALEIEHIRGIPFNRFRYFQRGKALFTELGVRAKDLSDPPKYKQDASYVPLAQHNIENNFSAEDAFISGRAKEVFITSLGKDIEGSNCTIIYRMYSVKRWFRTEVVTEVITAPYDAQEAAQFFKALTGQDLTPRMADHGNFYFANVENQRRTDITLSKVIRALEESYGEEGLKERADARKLLEQYVKVGTFDAAHERFMKLVEEKGAQLKIIAQGGDSETRIKAMTQFVQQKMDEARSGSYSIEIASATQNDLCIVRGPSDIGNGEGIQDSATPAPFFAPHKQTTYVSDRATSENFPVHASSGTTHSWPQRSSFGSMAISMTSGYEASPHIGSQPRLVTESAILVQMQHIDIARLAQDPIYKAATLASHLQDFRFAKEAQGTACYLTEVGKSNRDQVYIGCREQKARNQISTQSQISQQQKRSLDRGSSDPRHYQMKGDQRLRGVLDGQKSVIRSSTGFDVQSVVPSTQKSDVDSQMLLQTGGRAALSSRPTNREFGEVSQLVQAPRRASHVSTSTHSESGSTTLHRIALSRGVQTETLSTNRNERLNSKANRHQSELKQRDQTDRNYRPRQTPDRGVQEIRSLVQILNQGRHLVARNPQHNVRIVENATGSLMARTTGEQLVVLSKEFLQLANRIQGTVKHRTQQLARADVVGERRHLNPESIKEIRALREILREYNREVKAQNTANPELTPVKKMNLLLLALKSIEQLNQKNVSPVVIDTALRFVINEFRKIFQQLLAKGILDDHLLADKDWLISLLAGRRQRTNREMKQVSDQELKEELMRLLSKLSKKLIRGEIPFTDDIAAGQKTRDPIRRKTQTMQVSSDQSHAYALHSVLTLAENDDNAAFFNLK